CVAISAASWQAVGGFDPEFRLYFEDTDFVARGSRIQGQRCGIVRAPIRHYHSRSTKRDLRTTVPVFAWSAYVYLRHHTGLKRGSAKVVLCAALTIRLVLAAVSKGPAVDHFQGATR